MSKKSLTSLVVGSAHGVGLATLLSGHIHLGVVAHLQHVVRRQILVRLVVRRLFPFPCNKIHDKLD